MNFSKRDFILFFPTWYPTKKHPKPGDSINRLAKALSHDFRIVVLYVGGSNDVTGRYQVEHLLEDGIETHRLLYRRRNLESKAGIFQKINFMFWHVYLSIKGFKFILKKHGKPALVHVHVLTRNALMALLFLWRYRVGYCITERWSRYFDDKLFSRNTLHGWLTRFVVKKSKGISVVSEALKIAMQRNGIQHKKFFITPNVVETEIFSYQPRSKNDTPVFIHVSCFVNRDKNIAGIVRAANMLDKLGYKFDLKLIGDGVDRRSIEEMSKKMVWHNVKLTFEGDKTQPELAPFYNEADALIIFSNYETFCNVVAEAHCSGVPVIATKIAALPELVNENNGIFVSVKNEHELGEAMIRFCQGRTNFDSEQIADTANSIYGQHAIIKSMRLFYSALE
jgi:glycosyltransferase involved in cell wall biosynthesis